MPSAPFDTIDPAEEWISAHVRAWTDRAIVPIDAAATARSAASVPARRTRSVVRWNRSTRTAARLAVFAAVAALGSAAILFATGGAPTPTPVVAPSPSPSPAPATKAVVVRPAAGGIDVVLADSAGRERLLRRVTPEDLGMDPRYTLGSAYLGQANGTRSSAIDQDVWLELHADDGGEDRPGLAHFGLDVLVDLAETSRAPIVVLGDGFMGGRWGPDGLWAHYCAGLQPPSIGHRSSESDSTVGLPDCGMPQGTEVGIDGSAVRVLRPDAGIGSEIIVPYVQTFGGGPSIYWTADGSGFLAHDPTGWGTTPLDGGPFRPGTPKLLSREVDRLLTYDGGELDLVRSGLDDPGGWTSSDAIGDSGLAPATLVGAQVAADRDAVWQLLDDPAGPSPRALLAKLVTPGTVDSVRAYDLPDRPAVWFTLSPDDTFVAIQLEGSDDQGRFVLAPVGLGDAMVTAGPVIDGWLAGLVPAVIADTWPAS